MSPEYKPDTLSSVTQLS